MKKPSTMQVREKGKKLSPIEHDEYTGRREPTHPHEHEVLVICKSMVHSGDIEAWLYNGQVHYMTTSRYV